MAYEEINTKKLVVVAKEGLNSSEADKTIEVTAGDFGPVVAKQKTRGIRLIVGKSKNVYLGEESLDDLIVMLQSAKGEL